MAPDPQEMADLAKATAGVEELARDVTHAQALARLRDGNARYAANTPNQRDFSLGRAQRVAKQWPFAAVLSCSDSRVAPELAFDQGPGDLFVVRVAGNFINDDGLASLEYAVEFLGVKTLVVLGHTGCGAIEAAMHAVSDDAELPGALPTLIESLKPAVLECLDDELTDNTLDQMSAHNVMRNVRRLASADKLIAKRVSSGEVQIIGAMYDLRTGMVTFATDGPFPPLVEQLAPTATATHIVLEQNSTDAAPANG